MKLLPDLCNQHVVCAGEGVRRLCEHIGVPISQAVAFGDGENDAEMLAMVGHGVAMQNARPLPKSLAKAVTEVLQTRLFAFSH